MYIHFVNVNISTVPVYLTIDFDGSLTTGSVYTLLEDGQSEKKMSKPKVLDKYIRIEVKYFS